MYSTLNKNLYAATSGYHSLALTRELQALSLSHQNCQQHQQFNQQQHDFHFKNENGILPISDQKHQGMQSYHNQAADNLNGYNSTSGKENNGIVKKKSKLYQGLSNQMPNHGFSEKNGGFHPKRTPQKSYSAKATGSPVHPTNDKSFKTTNFATVKSPVSASPSIRPLEIRSEDNKIQYQNIKSPALSLPKNTSLTKSVTCRSKKPCDSKPIQCTTCKTWFFGQLSLRQHYRSTLHKDNTHNQQQPVSNADYPKENQYEQRKSMSPEKFSSNSIKVSENQEEFTYNDTQRQTKYLDMPLLDSDLITQQNNIPSQNVNVQIIQLADKPFKIEVEVPLFSNEESFRNENLLHASLKKSENPPSASINSPTVSTIKVKNLSTGAKQKQNTTTKGTSSKKNSTGFKCDDCKKEFSTICYLTEHNDAFHSEKKRYKCRRCNKCFQRGKNYQKHMKSHDDNNKPHKCETCPKRFYYKTDLRRHIAAHDGPRAHICKVCDKRFCRPDHLRKHYKLLHLNQSSSPLKTKDAEKMIDFPEQDGFPSRKQITQELPDLS